jgi:hypothetical protein
MSNLTAYKPPACGSKVASLDTAAEVIKRTFKSLPPKQQHET